ncbi:MAG: DNA-3-methyladenine glycosylase family protein [Pyrinomonadaceae bacterium]
MFLDFPKKFHFRRTVYSHGWYSLLPFKLDEENWRLSYVFSGGVLQTPVSAAISESGGKIEIETSEKSLTSVQKAKILADTRRIFRLDDDLSAFYKLTEREKEFAWISKAVGGRLLRSPTVYEDLVKTICTTNCSWAMTRKMVTNLVEKLGEVSGSGERAFPAPEKMAEMSPDFYREEIRAGYRAAYFTELAEWVAAGNLDPEAWLDPDLPTKELKRQMKQVKGVGDYAAENLLKLVGRYDGLALDSWVRAQFYKKHNAGEVCEDREIRKFYERFDDWSGLVIWCDVTEKWFK